MTLFDSDDDESKDSESNETESGADTEPLATVSTNGSDVDDTDEDEEDTDDESTIQEKATAGLSSTGGQTGGLIANGIIWCVDLFVKNLLGFFYAFSRLVPWFGERLWERLAKRSLYLYHRRAGGDAIGLEAITQEKADLTPVKYKPAEETDKDERAGWSAKSRDKVWSPTTFGRSTMRVGKVPIIPLDNDSWQATSFAECRVAEAVDQGDMRPLYDVSEAKLTAELEYLDEANAGGQGAVADGGTARVHDRGFEPKSHPVFKDYIIDLGGGEYDGQAISFWKTKEMMLETTSTEEMERQEERGFLAGRSRDDMKSWLLRVMLIAAAIALGGLMGPELVNAIFGGGGGGGGGSVIPFQLGSLAWWG